jgi:hypothetical protein
MLKASIKLGLALTVIAAMSASSFAQSPAGTPMAGSAGAGNSAISGIPPGPGNIDGVNNTRSDPSGLRNSLKVAAPPPPPISAQTVTPYH